MNNYRHGHAGGSHSKRSSEYTIWSGMKSRCTNPNDPNFKRYGARGISICKRWTKFENFFNDMGPRPFGKSIDRIDNSKRYMPSNCKWSNRKEQSQNRRTNKLNRNDVNEIKSLYKFGFKTRMIAPAYGVAKSTVVRIISEKTWQK